MEDGRARVAWWSWNRTIGPWAYFAAGVGLMALKFGIDWSIAEFGFGRRWQLKNYLDWPHETLTRVFVASGDDRRFALTLLWVAVPFVAIGVLLTLQRLHSAGWPLLLVVAFVLPWVNLLLFLLLCLAPDRKALRADDAAIEDAQRRATSADLARSASPATLASPAIRTRARAESLRSAIWAIFFSFLLAALLVWLAAKLDGGYGITLFVATPFLLGLVSVVLHGRTRPRRFRECMAVSFSALGVAAVGAIALAFEGAMCLAMSLPIAAAFVFVGATVGYYLLRDHWSTRRVHTLYVALFVLSPLLMAAESAIREEPLLRSVVTTVEIDAPPEVVWKHVIAFPPIESPPEWIFRAGIACPERAEILGEGPGAVRHCVFSTGTFVEPIEVWDPPRLLRFSVTDQPPPMVEWSPYDIHPPHLDGFLASRQGQFRLERIEGEDGRTRLEGTTWYVNRMWPQSYWGWWSDALIHAIHRRVLEHIERVAEGR